MFDAYDTMPELTRLVASLYSAVFILFLSLLQPGKIDDIDSHSYAYHSSTLGLQIA